MNRLASCLVPLAACAALAGCSSPPDAGGDAPATAAPTSAAPSTPSAPSASAPSSAPAASGGITFTGALSGRMTVSACHDGMAQLVVAVDGEDQTFNGLLDADDFTFAVPHRTGYTLADGSPRPTVTGATYTVRKARLVSITDDSTITADGSVTCP